jgi:hypothetical protein
VKKTTHQTPAVVVDYSAARAQAIRWLGDRYLLAKPINASRSLPPKLAQRATPATGS